MPTFSSRPTPDHWVRCHWFLIASVLALGCSGTNATLGSGGANGTGGSSQNGGNAGTAGGAETGGAFAAGGTAATGGIGAGGTRPGTGGATSTGGGTSAGGGKNTGGTVGTGGTHPGTGGVASTGTGGTTAIGSVITNRYDNLRSSSNTKETVLNTSNVNQAQFGLRYSFTVDGQVYAQPLYLVPGEKCESGRKDAELSLLGMEINGSG